MTVKVVLEIADALYQRAAAIAQTSQRSIASILADAISLDEPAEPSAQASAWPEWDEAIEQEIAAYHRLHGVLWRSYPGQYVAFYQQQLVDHDPWPSIR